MSTVTERRVAAILSFPWLLFLEYCNRKVLFVGGSPSLRGCSWTVNSEYVSRSQFYDHISTSAAHILSGSGKTNKKEEKELIT